jgi:GNAT superfamily N-acetyltransferase
MSVVIRQVDAASAEAVALMRDLDSDLRARYPGARITGIDAEAFRAAGGVFLIAIESGVPVACGALRPVESGLAEVKRMFVSAAARRRGHARAIVRALEDRARADGFARIRLETGEGQPEAIALYESAGYHAIPCYGEFEGSPHSRCFEKALGADVSTRAAR